VKWWVVIPIIGCVLATGCAHTGARSASVKAPAAAERIALARVHFPTGSTRVLARDRRVLEENAQQLRQDARAVVVLEGHCDERGGDAFNLELGDRRARGVLTELVRLGIDDARLIIVSQGKRRPLDGLHRPSAWARNRRVEFIVR